MVAPSGEKSCPSLVGDASDREDRQSNASRTAASERVPAIGPPAEASSQAQEATVSASEERVGTCEVPPDPEKRFSGKSIMGQRAPL